MLPLDKANNIVIGNALRLDWLEVCPPTAPVDIVIETDNDLFATPLEQTEINLDEDNLGGETYICGNPPYAGSSKQTKSQKDDVESIFSKDVKKWRSFDYVACWFKKASDFAASNSSTRFALVSTNSICQGEQVPILWPLLYEAGQDIFFAVRSFKWANLASQNAGVTVVVIGLCNERDIRSRNLYDVPTSGEIQKTTVDDINAYLTQGRKLIVSAVSKPQDDRGMMIRGNMPSDGGNLILTTDEKNDLLESCPSHQKFIRNYLGSYEVINGQRRHCIWIEDDCLNEAMECSSVRKRVEKVREMRLASSAKSTRDYADQAHKFRQIQGFSKESSIVVTRVSSENREYLPTDLYTSESIFSDRNFVICDAPLWNMALIASRLHWVWIGTVCVRLEMRFSYSNTLGWNTFPVPNLTDENKADLTRCAEDILLARAAHFPKTIADLYKPEDMPDDLRAAHERNDETLERIYIGRRFKTDTERLETLFDLYTKMTSQPQKKVKRA